MVGAEALVRYQLDQNLILAPNAFIPLLEETQTISQIDFFVFEFVCLRLQKWIREGRGITPVSVNFSRYTVLEKTFCRHCIELSDYYHIDRALLEIEITENALDVQEEALRHTIDTVRQAGFSVSIDDFGVEFSNLSLFSGADFDILAGPQFDSGHCHQCQSPRLD
ncbi:MAG: EAL domain-containing protein [Holdemania massiliensis]